MSPWFRFVRREGLVRRRYAMAPKSPKQKRALELAARKDIDLTGLGPESPEEVQRTILVGRRTDEIVRADRPAPGPRVPRASPRGGVVASSATGATSSDLFLSVGGEFRFD